MAKDTQIFLKNQGMTIAVFNLAPASTGSPVLGHAALSCAGAYTSLLLVLNFGLSP